MKIVRSILFVAACLVIVVAIIFLLLGLRPFILTSSSMEPTIEKGSLVIVDTRVKDVAIGDILAYRSAGNQSVLHRLVGMNELKGDANSISQHVELSSSLIGRYVFHIPKVGRLAEIMVKHKVIALVVVGLILIIAIFPLRRRRSITTQSSSTVEENEPSEEDETSDNYENDKLI